MSKSTARRSAQKTQRLRRFIFHHYGDGVTCKCVHCGTELDNSTMTIDRILPGALGGKYRVDNVQPSCRPCADAGSWKTDPSQNWRTA